jgi:pyrophosphatase PpaX
MKEYNAYLFDADGTLIDTTKLILECFKHTLPKFDLAVPADEFIVSHIGLPFDTQLAYYTGEKKRHLIPQIHADYKQYQIEIYKDYLTECPGTTDALSCLKGEGKSLAVVTSRSRHTLDMYLKHLKIYDFFEFSITPEDVDNPKPHPEPVENALRRLSAEADETLFVGDAIYDCKSALAANVDFAYVNWSHIPFSKFDDAQYRLNSMTDLTTVMECRKTQ